MEISLRIDGRGSHVPHCRLNQAHAASRPDATQAICTLPLGFIPEQMLSPVSTPSNLLSTHHQRFTCIRLPGSHLTGFSLPFPATLTTLAFDQRSSRWFGAWSCNPTPRGPPSSAVQHRTSEGHERLLTARSWRTAIWQVPRGRVCPPMAAVPAGGTDHQHDTRTRVALFPDDGSSEPLLIHTGGDAMNWDAIAAIGKLLGPVLAQPG